MKTLANTLLAILVFVYSQVNSQDMSTSFDNLEHSEYTDNVGGVLNEEEENMLNAAIATFQTGDLDKSIVELGLVINKYPISFYGYVYRAYMYAEQKKYDLAIADSKKVVKYYPQEPDGYISVSAYMMLSNRYKESRDYILHAFKLGHTFKFPVWANIGLYYWWKGDMDKAEDYLKKSIVLIGTKETYDGFLIEIDGEVASGRLPNNPNIIRALKEEFEKNGSKYIQYKKLDYETITLINEKKYYEAAIKNKEIVEVVLSTSPPNYELAMEYANYSGNQFANANKGSEAKQAYLKSFDYMMTGNVVNSKAGDVAYLQGEFFKEERDYTIAVKFLMQAVKINQQIGNEFNAGKVANSQGMFFTDEHDYVTAAKFYTKAIDIFQLIGDESWKGTTLSNLAEVEGFMGKNELSLKHNLEAIEIAKKLGEKGSLAISYNNTSEIYENLGNYEKAIELAKNATKLGEELQHTSLSSFYNSLGNRYSAAGNFELALVNYNKALTLAKKANNKAEMAKRLVSIGSTYYQMRMRTKAKEALEESISLAKESGAIIAVASGHHHLGLLALDLKKPYEAEEQLKKSLEIFRKYDMKREIAGDLLMLGKINSASFNKFQQAETYFIEAMGIYESMGLKYELSELYQALASFYVIQSKIDQAISYGEKGIAYYEETMLSGNSSISQLSAGIEQYELLAAYYGFVGQYNKAFDTMEKAKSRQLSSKLAGGEVKPVTTKEISDQVTFSTAMVGYLNTGYGVPLYITITNSGSYGFMTRSATGADGEAIEAVFKSLLSKYENGAKTAVNNQRGFKRIDGPKDQKLTNKAVFSIEKFEELINYYRILITNEGASGQVSPERVEIAKGLYNYLIEPIEDKISGKENIVIIPEGILGYLPFETLMTPSGQYLVEKYNIQYVQSATVWSQLSQKNYSQNRKPILAYGGAVYGGKGAVATSITKEEDLITLRSELLNPALKDYKPYYAKLGISSWENLPGTSQEVNNLKSIYLGAEVNTGCKVSENSLKTFSDQGKLEDYKVIHFATHGVVIPEIPELSALVLSQNCQGQKGDGYLTYGEIEKLKLKADFVNLSACETGLGKIYGGEGVVGLTQSFLIAGTKSLSVSLWQVADESTMQFMTGMYKKAKVSNSYSNAMTTMKREFISGEHGESLKLPYYWAPFIFYGQ